MFEEDAGELAVSGFYVIRPFELGLGVAALPQGRPNGTTSNQAEGVGKAIGAGVEQGRHPQAAPGR